jgi:hypothetical protein
VPAGFCSGKKIPSESNAIGLPVLIRPYFILRAGIETAETEKLQNRVGELFFISLSMKRKNKIIIRVIAAIAFLVGFALCGCDKNVPAAIDETISVERDRTSPAVQTSTPTTTQKGDSAAINFGPDSRRYDLGGYGSYTP